MSAPDYFDRLEAELRHAVKPRSRRHGRLLPAAAVAVATAVAVAAVALLGHSRRTGVHPAAPPAPPGAVSLRMLVAGFAELRRPQSPADRAWRPDHGAEPPPTLPGYQRLARRLPGGERIFLTVLRRPGGGYTLWAPIVFGDGSSRDTSFGPMVSLPTPTQAPGERSTRWTSIVPDGVAAVRWTFACRTRRAGCARKLVQVPVRDNIATAQVPGTTSCGDGACRRVTAATWLVAGGAAQFGFVSPVAARWVLGILAHHPPLPEVATAAPGMLRATGLVGAPFGSSPLRVTQVAVTALGPPSQPYRAGVECRVDHSIAWSRGGRVLTAMFRRGRFVGYQYGTVPFGRRPSRWTGALTTTRGLGLGDRLARGRRLYGRAFSWSEAQGGTWSVGAGSTRLLGFAWTRGRVGPGSLVATIDAGDVGCPALSP